MLQPQEKSSKKTPPKTQVLALRLYIRKECSNISVRGVYSKTKWTKCQRVGVELWRMCLTAFTYYVRTRFVECKHRAMNSTCWKGFPVLYKAPLMQFAMCCIMAILPNDAWLANTLTACIRHATQPSNLRHRHIAREIRWNNGL